MECPADEVHVWRVALDCSVSDREASRLLLSADEVRRAACFATRELRESWTVARAALRSILGTYCRSAPASLIFRLGPNGKPKLGFPLEYKSFNFSHTDDLALLAIAAGGSIGIDAETLRSDLEIEDMSRHFFALGETEEILKLPPDARQAAFFACWTRKEAFVKALGIGLSAPLSGFQVTVRADQPAKLISVDWDVPDRWSLMDLSEPGVAAALAVEGPPPLLRRFDFIPSNLRDEATQYSPLRRQ